MSLVECFLEAVNGLDGVQQYRSVLPTCEAASPRIVVTDFDHQRSLVIYDVENVNPAEGLEPVEVPSNWQKAFEFTAAQYASPKLKHKLLGKDGMKIWCVHNERKLTLGEVVAFDEGILGYLLAAWAHRNQQMQNAVDNPTEDRIAVRNGQLFWIPKWYPLKDNFGVFKFDVVLKHREAEVLLERLRESLQSFWKSPESKKWKRRLFFGSITLQLHQLPKHVVCVQLHGIECTSDHFRRRSQLLSPTEPVADPDEAKTMDTQVRTDVEKWLLCDVSSGKVDSDSEWH